VTVVNGEVNKVLPQEAFLDKLLRSGLNKKEENEKKTTNWHCSLCKKVFRKPTITPCCFTTFCDACIRQHLILDDNYRCPTCNHPVRLDELQLNERMHKKIQAARKKGQAASKPPEVFLDIPLRIERPARVNDLQPDIQTIKCLHCNKKGHMFRNCPIREQEEAEKKAKMVKAEVTNGHVTVKAEKNDDSTEETKKKKKKKKKIQAALPCISFWQTRFAKPSNAKKFWPWSSECSSGWYCRWNAGAAFMVLHEPQPFKRTEAKSKYEREFEPGEK